MNMDVNII